MPRPLTAAITALLVLVAGSGCAYAGNLFALVLGPDGPERVERTDVGRDPFAKDVAAATPSALAGIGDDLDAVATEAAKRAEAASGKTPDPLDIARSRTEAVIAAAKAKGLTVTAPSSRMGVGIWGGSGTNACDLPALKNFLAAKAEQAGAWAAVQGITVDQIPAYLDGLTPGFLLTSTTVVNHRFTGGKAVPFRAVLASGTAVLVDDDGVPRARCKCGNPLKPVLIDLGDQSVSVQAFADQVVDYHGGDNIDAQYRDPAAALGPPDYRNDSHARNEVSLGTAKTRCEFSLTVKFVDNTLTNGPGDDLRIVEIGEVEPSDVFVQDGDLFVPVGQISGGDSSIDLSPALPEGEDYQVVKICDAPDVDVSDVPGADIDAVAALHWKPA
jgi:hypothetical protein